MERRNSRRQFLRTTVAGMASAVVVRQLSWAEGLAENHSAGKPNLVFIFADQWRARSTGYAGNKDVKTPNLDRLASQGINFSNAVSGCPVCSPYRASLLTGQYWLTHGIFYNDKPLNPDAETIGKVYRRAGYETGYIGKWHI
ncbi:MAG: sulfatase-like hydrolase/transferase, partial [Planctomycetota bacterium]